MADVVRPEEPGSCHANVKESEARFRAELVEVHENDYGMWGTCPACHSTLLRPWAGSVTQRNGGSHGDPEQAAAPSHRRSAPPSRRTA